MQGFTGRSEEPFTDDPCKRKILLPQPREKVNLLDRTWVDFTSHSQNAYSNISVYCMGIQVIGQQRSSHKIPVMRIGYGQEVLAEEEGESCNFGK